MRLRILVLLPASILVAACVLLTPASFEVQRWMAPLGESVFAYRHPVAVTAFAALLPWMVAGTVGRWRFVMRMPAIFLLVAWTALALPVMGITIAEEQPLHRDAPGVREQMRTGRARMRVAPRRAAEAALARGDCRPLATMRLGPRIRGVDELPDAERSALEPYGYQAIPGTSDDFASPGHRRYGWKAYRYATAYNERLLTALRTADGRLDLARCRLPDSNRFPLLP